MALVRRHRPDYQLVLFMGLLMLLGLIIMFAIGPQRANVLNNAYGSHYSDTYFFLKQLGSVVIAGVAFAAMAVLPFTFWQKHAYTVLLGGLAACVLLVVTGNLLHMDQIAQCSLGACRWFQVGPLGFQPAELVKFGVLLYAAGLLGVRSREGLVSDLRRTIYPLGIVVGVASLFIIFIQKDMGTGLSLLAIVASMLFVAGVNLRTGLIIGGVALLGLILLIVVAPHRIERITTFLGRGSADQTGDSYHITHAKIAIGSGGLFGVGVGNSVEATGYLPEAINDSVFAIMGETFGFVGLIVILLLFTGLLMRLLRVTDHLPDMQLRLVAAGIFGWLAAHVMLNVAAMIGVAPLTGITLPLLSFGGTSMIFIAAILGLAFQLSRYTTHDLGDTQEARYENTGSRRGIGRTRYAGRRSTTGA